MDVNEAEMHAMMARCDDTRRAWRRSGGEATDVFGVGMSGSIRGAVGLIAADIDRRMAHAVDFGNVLRGSVSDLGWVHRWFRGPMIVFNVRRSLYLIAESAAKARWLRDVFEQIGTEGRSS